MKKKQKTKESVIFMQIFCCLISCTEKENKKNNAENSFSKMSRATVKPKQKINQINYKKYLKTHFNK